MKKSLTIAALMLAAVLGIASGRLVSHSPTVNGQITGGYIQPAAASSLP
ncbi:hypothetical protein [Bradyrhizobium lablabi]|nr:hypothetical protein [Bradyrhizobium lablabi]MBR0693252.1 hypothetical protein [Bradyrhizobium lablabi]